MIASDTLVPRREQLEAAGPPVPIVTWDQVASTLPARIVDAIEATSPCPGHPGRHQHAWSPVVHEIEMFGRIRLVRSDEFLQCDNCSAAVDRQMHRELML